MPLPHLLQTINIPGEPEPLPHLVHFESRGRTSHVHWDGCEVQRQFYIDRFKAAPHACAALLGFVLQEGTRFVRYLPAVDTYYDEILYCNEAKWDHVEKKAISNSTAIDPVARNLDQAQAYVNFMERVNRIAERPEGGAFINASYRPLISAYHGDAYGHRADPPNRFRQFDFMDPVIVPGNKTYPWPLGLVVKPSQPFTREIDVPPEVADPLMLPTKQLSMRRMFLGRVPYEILDAALGAVNNAPWPAGNPREIDWAWTIPQFPKETLRFESYEVTPHWSQLSVRNVWFEVKLNFTAIAFRGSPVYDSDEVKSDIGDVTWNHGFFATVGQKGLVA